MVDKQELGMLTLGPKQKGGTIMAIPAVRGVYHDGKIEPLEDISYKKDMKVVIVFLENTEEDMAWNEAVARDFFKGYSERDTAYDGL